jgi:hypothetical protein
MSIPISHNWQKGLWRLTHCMQDVTVADASRGSPIARTSASPKHKKLFKEYREYLEDAVAIAGEWWEGRIETKTDEGMSAADALEECYEESPAGPASRGEVVWTVRNFWLRCDEINRGLPEDKRVLPEVFLLQWLFDDGVDEEARVLAGMPYWPIGMDADGQWV